MPRKPIPPPAGIDEFVDALRGVSGVTKKQLDAEIAKYKKRKATKAAKAKRPSR